jgi:hypothetical protein
MFALDYPFLLSRRPRREFRKIETELLLRFEIVHTKNAQKTTDAHTKANADVRNAVAHAAVSHAMRQAPNTLRGHVHDHLIFNFDMTGVGLKPAKWASQTSKAAHPKNSTMPSRIKVDNKAAKLSKNLKVASGGNCHSNIDLALVQKCGHVPEGEVWTAKLKGVSFDGSPVHFILSMKHLTSESVIAYVLAEVMFPFVHKQREMVMSLEDPDGKRDPEYQEPWIFTLDNEEQQCKVMERPEIQQMLKDTDGRYGTLSTSQTPVEQGEDQQSSFREFKKTVNSRQADDYESWNQATLQFVTDQLTRQLEPRLPEKLTTKDKNQFRKDLCSWASGIVRMQHSRSKDWTAHDKARSRWKTGDVPFDILRKLQNHNGFNMLDPDHVQPKILEQMPVLMDIAFVQGYLNEDDHDAANIPETEENRLLRAQGKDPKAGFKRYTWKNHKNVVELNKAIVEDKATKEAAATAKRKIRADHEDRWADFRSGAKYNMSELKGSLKERYLVANEDGEVSLEDCSCAGCNNWWSAWIFNNLRTDQKKWRHTKEVEGLLTKWYCGDALCSKARIKLDKDNTILRDMERKAQKATKELNKAQKKAEAKAQAKNNKTHRRSPGRGKGKGKANSTEPKRKAKVRVPIASPSKKKNKVAKGNSNNKYSSSTSSRPQRSIQHPMKSPPNNANNVDEME